MLPAYIRISLNSEWVTGFNFKFLFTQEQPYPYCSVPEDKLNKGMIFCRIFASQINHAFSFFIFFYFLPEILQVYTEDSSETPYKTV